MAAVVYTTKDGDMVDAICFRRYGRSAGITEAVLAANIGLAAHGPILPAGIEINLPDYGTPEKRPEKKETVQLWD
ncbi:MAG: tail protein X [Kiritimatiellales bacterium]